MKRPKRHYWFAAFFAFGATMCFLTVMLLVFPGTKLDSLWSLNPDAHVAFQSLGGWSDWMRFDSNRLMAWDTWGIRLALAILLVNVIGDLVNVITRHDFRSLVGVPIAGAMIFYLARSTARHSAH